MIPCKSLKIKITTDLETKESPLPTTDCLKAIGKRLSDITQINWDSSYFPDITYTEHHTARRYHPLQGSGSSTIEFTDSSKSRISVITYQDYNIAGLHYFGKEHWNIEYRVETVKDKIKDMSIHQLDKSPWVEIEVVDCCSGTSFFKKRLNWVERKP